MKVVSTCRPERENGAKSEASTHQGVCDRIQHAIRDDQGRDGSPVKVVHVKRREAEEDGRGHGGGVRERERGRGE